MACVIPNILSSASVHSSRTSSEGFGYSFTGYYQMQTSYVSLYENNFQQGLAISGSLCRQPITNNLIIN